jgi:hypothetical protein
MQLVSLLPLLFEASGIERQLDLSLAHHFDSNQPPVLVMQQQKQKQQRKRMLIPHRMQQQP